MALSVALGSLAERGSAQVQVEARPPIALVAELSGRAAQTQTDLGRAPKMLQSPNVDRFLRRAQDFLSRDDFAGAIQILQDVVEGRTLIDPAADCTSILILAVLAVVVATALIGLAIAPVAGMPLLACLLLAALVSTTDPSAVELVRR